MNKKRKNFYVLLTSTIVIYLLSLTYSKQRLALSQQSQNSQVNERYYSYRPSGCGSIKKLQIEEIFDYFLIGTCSREGGAWLQQVTAIETKTRGVIYLKGEKLLNGGALSRGYWCSLKAPGSKEAGMLSVCTKNGWTPNK
jgi:hypothetical protein